MKFIKNILSQFQKSNNKFEELNYYSKYGDILLEYYNKPSKRLENEYLRLIEKRPIRQSIVKCCE